MMSFLNRFKKAHHIMDKIMLMYQLLLWICQAFNKINLQIQARILSQVLLNNCKNQNCQVNLVVLIVSINNKCMNIN